MLTLYIRLINWLKEQEGQGMAEYGLIIALVAIVVIGGISLLGTNLSTIFSSLGSKIGTGT